MAMARVESIRCLLIPITDHNLLLPAAVVAEVIDYREPDPLPDRLADREWLLGFTSWHDQQVPLVSMEAVMTGERADPSIRARIVILKGTGQRSQLPHFGVLTRRLPRLTTIFEPTVEHMDELGPTPGIHDQVLANGEPALLPDLDEIESQMYAVLFG